MSNSSAGRVGSGHTAPLLGTAYAAARQIKLGDHWRDAGYVLTDEDLAGRNVEVMLLAGDIVAVTVPARKGRKR